MISNSKQKYIKIGFSLGSEPLQEFYLKPKAKITIGSSSKNRISIPSWQHREKFPFLKYTRKGYSLRVTDDISGRISIDGRSITIEELFERGLAKWTKDSYQIYISEKVRGKFLFDGAKVLLTFVSKENIKN